MKMEFMYVMRLWRALISRFALTSAEVRGLKNYLSLIPFSAFPLHPKLSVGSNLSHRGEGIYVLRSPPAVELCDNAKQK